ncbi:hypothetical protein [Roseovarius mucosus]|uniref:hypothetical protein n=1 Tax=Roseovarius mucosus TaxID=215743 RepID=UPI000B046BA4|nr:hypothetical protein [Roseovarius mucosus]
MSHFSKLIVVLALSLALAAIGFGHRDLNARAFDPTYLAFVAAGGTAQDLCEDHAAHDAAPGPSDHQGNGSCEACRLVDTLVVLAMPETAQPWQAPRIAPLAPGAPETRTQTVAHRLAQVRAPPQA